MKIIKAKARQDNSIQYKTKKINLGQNNPIQKKKYWITDSRFKIILLVLFIMWLGLMVLFYLKADEVTKHPCSVCANRLNEQVTCSVSDGGKIILKTYYPNFTKVQGVG